MKRRCGISCTNEHDLPQSQYQSMLSKKPKCRLDRTKRNPARLQDLDVLTPEYLQSGINRHAPVRQLYIAYSGGVDSHVLLHLCAQLPEWQRKMTAVYIHHGLQEIADDWAQHCACISAGLNVHYQCIRVRAQPQVGESPEEAARNARYQALAGILQNEDLMLFAQHQDDQLETVLLQLFRGAGLQGLAGMPEITALGQGRMLRPLLHTSRQEIERYARQQQLHWIEDPSNDQDIYDRNYLRNTILPQIQQRWPGVARTVSRTAKHCASAHTALQAQTVAQLQKILDTDNDTLDLSKLAGYTEFQQQAILRAWFAYLGLKMPSEAVLHSLMTQVIHAAATRDPALHYQQQQIRRYRHRLYCLPMLEKIPATQWPKQQTTIILNSYAQLQLKQAASGIDPVLWQRAQIISIKARQGGEKISIPGRTGHHSLKKLLQEAAIPPWMREQIPLIYLDEQLTAVGDLWISAEAFVQAPGAIRFIWQVDKQYRK